MFCSDSMEIIYRQGIEVVIESIIDVGGGDYDVEVTVVDEDEITTFFFALDDLKKVSNNVSCHIEVRPL